MSTTIKDDNISYNEDLNFYLRPSTFPLAVKMVEEDQEPSPECKRPASDLGADMPLCQAIGVARRNAWSLYLESQDISCASAIIYLGFAEAPEYYLSGEVAFAPYTQSQEARERRAALLPKLPPGKYKGIVLAPLFKADFVPDAVLIYGNPAQMMRMIQAAVFETGETKTFGAQGGGSCALEVAGTILGQDINLVFPGNGARVFGGVQDDELVCGIPRPRQDDMIEWLKQTHRGGQRYPIPKYAIYRPKMPPAYESLLKTVRSKG